MKKRLKYIAAIVLATFTVTAFTQSNPFPAGPDPDRIVLNVTEDPSTSLAVTWRTCDSIQTGFAEIMETNADPAASLNAVRQTAASEKFQLGDISVFYHSYIFKTLKPRTKYMYRVGRENHWSEWFHVTTAGLPGDKLSFIYMGDVQTGIKSFWSGLIRSAYAKMPDANAVMYAGDIVNRGEFDNEWGELFYAGSFIHSVIPGIMSPGNHEYAKTRDDKLSAFWRPQFTLPENGPEGVKETAYFTDIQGMRFISLNSNQAEEVPADLESQKEWLDSVLQHNPNKWTCVIFHHPIYSIAPQRDNPWMRDNFKPLFDKYKVDLVMQGHDHAYARGMKKITGAAANEFSGTMYVISMSGSKMYKENEKPWMDKNGGHLQLYQLITVEKNTLSYKCYTATGELYDSFKLIKQKGKKNKLVED